MQFSDFEATETGSYVGNVRTAYIWTIVSKHLEAYSKWCYLNWNIIIIIISSIQPIGSHNSCDFAIVDSTLFQFPLRRSNSIETVRERCSTLKANGTRNREENVWMWIAVLSQLTISQPVSIVTLCVVLATLTHIDSTSLCIWTG